MLVLILYVTECISLTVSSDIVGGNELKMLNIVFVLHLIEHLFINCDVLWILDILGYSVKKCMMIMMMMMMIVMMMMMMMMIINLNYNRE